MFASNMKNAACGTESEHRPRTSDLAVNCQEGRSTMKLSPMQVSRLRAVLHSRFDVHGRGNFPTLRVRLVDLVSRVRAELLRRRVAVAATKVNGGAASAVLAAADDFSFLDVDLIFDVRLPDADAYERVRAAVLAAVADLLPAGCSRAKLDDAAVRDAYVRKMVKVDEWSAPGGGDRWSLFSLNNHYGRSIELKFVDRMRRQYEFSVDSFQIRLDPMLDAERRRLEAAEAYAHNHAAYQSIPPEADDFASSSSGVGDSLPPGSPRPPSSTCDDDRRSMTSESPRTLPPPAASDDIRTARASECELPRTASSIDLPRILAGCAICDDSASPRTPSSGFEDDGACSAVTTNSEKVEEPIIAESVYGDIRLALRHLNERLIDTKHPEQIRGGGLLKYCALLVRGYRPTRAWRQRQQARYMCSRFFIDFASPASQELKLRAYLDGHLDDASAVRHRYLVLLRRVVGESTVCLMQHERRETLAMLDRLVYELGVNMYYERMRPPPPPQPLFTAAVYCRTVGPTAHHAPTPTLLYLTHDAAYWIPVV